METIQSRARSIITLPTSEALAVPSYVLSTAIMIHRAADASSTWGDPNLVILFDHESAIREDKARHSFLPTMGHGPAYGLCQVATCRRPYADSSAHTRTALTATGVVTR